MESLVLTNQNLTSFDAIEIELRSKSKSLLSLNLSNNLLKYLVLYFIIYL